MKSPGEARFAPSRWGRTNEAVLASHLVAVGIAYANTGICAAGMP
jgi:hypothetical protein